MGWQIVIAWTESERVVVRERRTDLGERPEMKDVRVAKTVLWLNDGGAADVVRAKEYVRTDRPDGRVYRFALGVSDARAEAARRILADTNRI